MCASVRNSVVHFTIRETAMGLGVPDDHVFDQNSSRDLGGLVCEANHRYLKKKMRGKQTTLRRGFHSISEEHLGPLAAHGN